MQTLLTFTVELLSINQNLNRRKDLDTSEDPVLCFTGTMLNKFHRDGAVRLADKELSYKKIVEMMG